MDAKVGQERVIKKKKIHLMHGVGRELYQYPELLERYTLVLEQLKAKTLLETKNDKTEPFLLWEYHEKAGYFGKKQ